MRVRSSWGASIGTRPAAPDVDRQRLGAAGEPLLGDHAATGLAVDLVVAAGTLRADALDRPQLPARTAQDEGGAAVADGEGTVLDLPAHGAPIGLAPLRGEGVGHRLPALSAGSPFGLDDHARAVSLTARSVAAA